MKINNTNSWISNSVVAIVLMVFQLMCNAQPDSNCSKSNFHFNLDAEFEPAFLNLNVPFFSEIQEGAKVFYNDLNKLELKDKQNLAWEYNAYKSFVESKLAQVGLPYQLIYLAPALSNMNAELVSDKGNAGIWQLSHFQGRLNGLEINRLVDERFNANMATEAAILQLKQNAALYEDIELAVLAYLAGNTKLKNTLVRCGESTSLDEVLKRLPESVSQTIAAFQAMSVFFTLNKFEPESKILPPDRVTVNRRVHFQQIAQVLKTTEKQLKVLNPQYRFSIIPGNEKPLTVRIPAGKHDEFVLWTDSIYNAYDSTLFQVVTQKIEYPPAHARQYVGEKVKDLEIEGKTKLKYIIKSGDVLGFIAEEYDVRVADLKYWNNIYNERRIQVGQKLDIFVDEDKAAYYSGLQKKSQPKTESTDMLARLTKSSIIPVYKVPNSAKKVEHIVKSGESPYVIAKKYAGVTPENILEWNGIQDARKIQIGQKLIIYLAP